MRNHSEFPAMRNEDDKMEHKKPPHFFTDRAILI